MPKALILHPFPHSPASYESTRMVWSEFLYLYIIAPVPSALCSDFAFRYLQCCVLCTLWSWIISGFSPHWHKRIYRILPVCLSWLQQVCDNSKFPAFLPRSSSLWTTTTTTTTTTRGKLKLLFRPGLTTSSLTIAVIQSLCTALGEVFVLNSYQSQPLPQITIRRPT